MDASFFFPFGIALLLARLTPAVDTHPDFVTWLGVASILSGFLSLWIKDIEKKRTPSKKAYLEFLDFMTKEARKFQKDIFPSNSKWIRVVWRRLVPYKPISEKKLMKIKFKYSKWRTNLHDAIQFVFKEPKSGGAPAAFILFGKHGHLDPRVDWGRQLKMDLEAVEILKRIKSIEFSKEFEEEPLRLNEYRDYMI